MQVTDLLKTIKDDLECSGGHCGESTSEMIGRQRWEDKLQTTIKVIEQYLREKQ